MKGSAGGRSSILPTFTVICRGWKAAGKWLESGLPLFNGRLIVNAPVSPPGVAAAAPGREMRKVEPRDPVSSSASVPPCPLTRSAAMTSPRPEPPCRTLPRNGWNRLSRAFCGRPGPVSRTRISLRPAASAARDRHRPGPPRRLDRLRGVAHEVRQHPEELVGVRPHHQPGRHLRREGDAARPPSPPARSPAPPPPAAPAPTPPAPAAAPRPCRRSASARRG